MEFTQYAAAQRPALMRFATILTGQTWLADDLVNDVLGRAFERWDRIGAMDEPNAYVRRMLVNDYVSWHRRWQRAAPHADLDPEPYQDGTAEHADRDDMMRRLRELTRKQRVAVVLRFYLGLPDAQIAEHLGCREATVRSHIARGIATLRRGFTDTSTEQEQSWTASPNR